MDVVARAMALVEVLIPSQMQQVQLIDQAVALQQVDGAVDRDAVHVGIDLLRAVENRAGVEMALGVVHHLKDYFSLARQTRAALGKRFLEAARALVCVDAFAGGNSMGGCGHMMSGK